MTIVSQIEYFQHTYLQDFSSAAVKKIIKNKYISFEQEVNASKLNYFMALDSGYGRKRVSTSSSIQRSQEVVPSFSVRSSDGSQRASSLNSISSSEGSS